MYHRCLATLKPWACPMSADRGKQRSCESQDAARGLQQSRRGHLVNGFHSWLQERKRAEQKGDWGGINKFLNRLLVCACYFKLIQ